jgi:DNA-binding ferritin-like protein
MIGLNIEHTEKLSLKLNELVANFQVYYQILRNLH